MQKLGLSSEELFKFAIIKNLELSSEKINEVLQNKDLIEKISLNTALALAREEAIFISVAHMIEENNRVITEQLKKVGFKIDL